MLFKVGDKVKTGFCTGRIVEVIDGRTRPGWASMPYFELWITKPRLHRSKRSTTIRMDEIKGRA